MQPCRLPIYILYILWNICNQFHPHFQVQFIWSQVVLACLIYICIKCKGTHAHIIVLNATLMNSLGKKDCGTAILTLSGGLWPFASPEKRRFWPFVDSFIQIHITLLRLYACPLPVNDCRCSFHMVTFCFLFLGPWCMDLIMKGVSLVNVAIFK